VCVCVCLCVCVCVCRELFGGISNQRWVGKQQSLGLHAKLIHPPATEYCISSCWLPTRPCSRMPSPAHTAYIQQDPSGATSTKSSWCSLNRPLPVRPLALDVVSSSGDDSVLRLLTWRHAKHNSPCLSTWETQEGWKEYRSQFEHNTNSSCRPYPPWQSLHLKTFISASVICEKLQTENDGGSFSC